MRTEIPPAKDAMSTLSCWGLGSLATTLSLRVIKMSSVAASRRYFGSSLLHGRSHIFTIFAWPKCVSAVK